MEKENKENVEEKETEQVKDTPSKEPEIKEEEKENKEKSKESEEINKLKQQLSFLQAENEKLKKEEESWKNKYYEAYADLANTRKSLEKDHQQLVKYRVSGFVDKILPALDSFEMALKADIQDPVAKNFAIGFKMILGQIEQAMKEEGISFIEPNKGDKFDELKMHAIQTCEGEEDNLIASTMARGYMLHDRLLRPAMVVVTKKSQEDKENKDSKDDSSSTK